MCSCSITHVVLLMHINDLGPPSCFTLMKIKKDSDASDLPTCKRTLTICTFL